VDGLAHRYLSRDDLPALEQWFDDTATTRWLGGRDWPHRLIELATLPGRFVFVWLRGDEPVALLDLERYDDATAAIAIVVSPEERRRAIATRILGSIFELTELEGVDRVFGEVEQGNAGGEGLLRAAGLMPHAGEARGDAFSRWTLHRPG
jgi:RimJ/RimL family protein N-acetyltransferase